MLSHLILALTGGLWLALIAPVLTNPLRGSHFNHDNKHNEDHDDNGHQASIPLPSVLLSQRNSLTWLSDLAVRRDGALLITETITGANLYLLKAPLEPGNTPFNHLYTFPSVTGALGITECEPDHFIVTTANFTSAGIPVPHSGRIFSIDFRAAGLQSSPAVRLLPSGQTLTFPNGVAALPWDPTRVLVADSAQGAVFAVSTRGGGATTLVAQLPEMAPVPQPGGQRVGVVGLRVRDLGRRGGGRWLYFSNGFAGGVWRVCIDDAGRPTGAPARLVRGLGYTWLEHFEVSEGGRTVWSATMPNNTLYATRDGRNEAVLGSNNTLPVAGVTSCRFGRMWDDKEKLYCCTNGGLLVPVNDTIVEPGKVVRVDTGGY